MTWKMGRSLRATIPWECGINRALPACVWIMKAVQPVDDIIGVGNGGGTGGRAWEPDDSKPLSAMYVLVVDVLSVHRRIELRVAVFIWLSNVVWSRGIIGGTDGPCDGVRSGDRTVQSIAEWLPRKSGAIGFICPHVQIGDIFWQDTVSPLSFMPVDDQTMTGHT